MLFFFFRKIYLLFEKERVPGRGGEGKERESEADSMLSAEPNAGLDPTTPRPQPDPKPSVRRSTVCATQASQSHIF